MPAEMEEPSAFRNSASEGNVALVEPRKTVWLSCLTLLGKPQGIRFCDGCPARCWEVFRVNDSSMVDVTRSNGSNCSQRNAARLGTKVEDTLHVCRDLGEGQAQG